MQATDDIALLREYAAHNSQTAFETLVSRYAGFVYSAALRQVRDPLLAEEISQAVFIILAKKAGRIGNNTNFPGWLFKTTRFAALAQMKSAARRRQHEMEAQMQSDVQAPGPDPLWDQLSPLLDEALARLGERDRQAVFLRFFENKSLAEVGNSLGAGEDTARMRINRALEKLHRFLRKRGVVSSTALLASAMSANSVHAAPAGLVTSITLTIAKGPAVAAPILALVKGTLDIMTWIKTKTAILIAAGTLVAGAAVLTLQQQEEQNRTQEEQVRAEEQQLRDQVNQPNLAPDDRIKLEANLDQLEARQNQLRTTQDQLRRQQIQAESAQPNLSSGQRKQLQAQSDRLTAEQNQDQTRGVTSALFGGNDLLKISPFTMVQLHGDKISVTYNGGEYQLAAVDGLTTQAILDFCRQQYKDEWQKRFTEDLVAVLADMGHSPASDHTVSLTLTDSKTGETKSIQNAPMTVDNRHALLTALRAL